MSSRLIALGLLLLAGPARAQEHGLFTAILADHTLGGLVDYGALDGDARLDAYLERLRSTDPAAIAGRDERLAFWINAYNAFTLRLVLDHQPLASIRDIEVDGRGPWDIPFIEIAGERMTLNRIEHEIIRPEFREPRIHMALVCAALSCPPLRAEAYRGEDLERQLEDNTRRFLADSTRNRYDPLTRTLFLSEIFSWFGEDFGSVREFVGRYYDVSPGEEPAIRFLPYDWSLNRVRPR